MRNIEETEAIETVVRTVYEADEHAQLLLCAVQLGARRLPLDLVRAGVRVELSRCRTRNGLVFVKDRLYVPNDDEVRSRVIRTCHDELVAGHPGREGTYQRVSAHYYWPRMTSTIARYVKSCLLCQRSKPSRDAKHGLLNPLPVPEQYWHSISLDFIVDLPESTVNGTTFRNILVVVDRLSKKKKFVPMDKMDAESVAHAFLQYIWREEGYPLEVISDRGRQFTSHFWRALCSKLGSKPKLSTAYHPETDGQTENANAWLKQYLRSFVNYQQDDWATYLPVAEFVANSTVSDSTGVSPFVAIKGY